VSLVGPGILRIVAGSRRGRRLRVPAEGSVRPTGERVREAIFDVLGPVGGLRALDLFAGSGAMGLESLSRGAAYCAFVEADARVAAVLRKNISTLGFAAASFQIIVTDYLRATERLAGLSAGFDLLFVDPPYRMLQEVEVTLSPRLPALLADDGLVVVESHRSVRAEMGIEPVFDRVYGDTRVVMLKMRRSQ
jgi:16S rRNA (guanine966-N2)-methyltransferase